MYLRGGQANKVWGTDNNGNPGWKTPTTSNVTHVNGVYTGSGGQQSPAYVTSGKTRFNMWNAFKGISNPASGYMDVILMDNYTGTDVPYVTGIGVTKNNGNPRMFIANGAKGGTGNWSHQVEAITTANISSQSVSSATSATKLNSNAGSATRPVYFSGGKPVACDFEYVPYWPTPLRWKTDKDKIDDPRKLFGDRRGLYILIIDDEIGTSPASGGMSGGLSFVLGIQYLGHQYGGQWFFNYKRSSAHRKRANNVWSSWQSVAN